MTHALTIDLDTGLVCRGSQALSKLSIQGAGTQDFDLTFLMSGADASYAEVLTISSIEFEVAELADFTGDTPFVYENSFALNSDGLTYQGTPDFATAEVETAIGTAASVSLHGQFRINLVGGDIILTPVFDVTILADVLAGLGTNTPAVFPRLVTTSGRIPTVSDDISTGHAVGSVWIHAGVIRTLTDNTEGAAVWASGVGATGDMEVATYDPTGVVGDAFDMASMVEAADAKVMTAAERAAISTNTSDIAAIDVPSAAGTFGESGLQNVICLGDSITLGSLDTGGVVDSPYPETLAAMTGLPIVNKGLSGWTPDHRVWKFLIDDCPTVFLDDIKLIPPSEDDDARVNQPTVDNGTRNFFADGDTVWVHRGSPSEATSRQYQYVAASTATADDDGVLAVAGGTGRWIEQAGTFVATDDNNLANADIIEWVGPNGMNATRLIAALEMLERNRGPRRGSMWFLTLPNRLPPGHADIADWTQWCAECNEALRLRFPGQVIDVDGFIMGRGEVGKLDYYHTVDADDDSDIAEGIVPRSMKVGISGGYSHFSQSGYDEIAAFVGRELLRRGAIKRLAPAMLAKDIIRQWSASGTFGAAPDGSIRSLASTINAGSATALLAPQGVPGPKVARIEEIPVLEFDGSGTQRVGNDFGTQSQPNTVYWAGRVRNWEDARVDLMDAGTGNAARHAISIYSGYWSMLRDSWAASTVPASGDWVVIIAAFNGASSSIWVNGVKTTGLNPGSSAFNGIYLPGSVGDFDGYVHSAGYVDGLISDANATLLNDSLFAALPKFNDNDFATAADLAAQGAINWDSAWALTTPYSTDDAVAHDGSSYICTAGHTATAGDEPGVGGSWASYWDVLALAGSDGSDGSNGAAGVGVPVGGSTSQVLSKISATDYDTQWVSPAGGGDALVANPLSQFAPTTSAQLAGVISDETGSGPAVFATSPALVTPNLGTPSALVGTNITGTAAGLTVGATTGVEAGADVTANAGALMDSEVTNLAQVKAFDASDYATAAQGTLADAAAPKAIYIEKHAASHTIDASECYGGVHYVTAAATITLPAAVDGMSLTIITVGAVAVSVDPNASDLIMLDGVALDDGDKITNLSTSGDIAVLTYYDATGWYAATNSWTDGGA